MNPKISIICHLFYPLVADEVLEKISYIINSNTKLFINIQCNSLKYNHLYEKASSLNNSPIIISAPNKGRDIGGKLLLIQLSILLKNEAEYTLIVHDKKSPHTETGDRWREELFKIISPQYVSKIFKLFENKPEVGIIASSKFIQNEFDDATHSFLSNCKEQLLKLIKQYDIKTNDYSFVSGNIFWIRTNLLKAFFKTRSIMKIHADLEQGNAVDFYNGTYIHAWERIMSWIATSQGYKIYGI